MGRARRAGGDHRPAAAYIDSTGEPAFIRRVFENHGPVAKQAGVPLLTAMGYDFVPGALAGALALEEAGEAAVRVDVGYYALGMTTQSGSAGTRASLVGATLDESHAFRDGALRTVRTAERVRSFTGQGQGARRGLGRRRRALRRCPAAYPRLREVNVYLGWFGPLARPMQAGALVGSVATRLPGVREALTFAGERLAALAEGPDAGTTPGGESWIAAQAFDGGRRQLAEVHLCGGNWYAFTADFIAWAARAARGRADQGRRRARAGRGVRARGARARLRRRRAQPRRRLSSAARADTPRAA